MYYSLILVNYIYYSAFYKFQLPDHIVEDIGDGSGVPEVIVELDQYSAQMNGEDDVCMENLKVVSLLEPF